MRRLVDRSGPHGRRMTIEAEGSPAMRGGRRMTIEAEGSPAMRGGLAIVG